MSDNTMDWTRQGPNNELDSEAFLTGAKIKKFSQVNSTVARGDDEAAHQAAIDKSTVAKLTKSNKGVKTSALTVDEIASSDPLVELKRKSVLLKEKYSHLGRGATTRAAANRKKMRSPKGKAKDDDEPSSSKTKNSGNDSDSIYNNPHTPEGSPSLVDDKAKTKPKEVLTKQQIMEKVAMAMPLLDDKKEDPESKLDGDAGGDKQVSPKKGKHDAVAPIQKVDEALPVSRARDERVVTEGSRQRSRSRYHAPEPPVEEKRVGRVPRSRSVYPVRSEQRSRSRSRRN